MAFGFIIHALIGMVATVPAIISFNYDQSYILLGAVGGLLPDIDHPKSFIGKYNPLAGFMKHRGFTHTVLGCAILSIPFIVIHAWLIVFSGALSHIVSDSFSSGLKWKPKVW